MQLQAGSIRLLSMSALLQLNDIPLLKKIKGHISYGKTWNTENDGPAKNEWPLLYYPNSTPNTLVEITKHHISKFFLKNKTPHISLKTLQKVKKIALNCFTSTTTILPTGLNMPISARCWVALWREGFVPRASVEVGVSPRLLHWCGAVRSKPPHYLPS